MKSQEAETLQVGDAVVWIPDKGKGEVIEKNLCSVKMLWEDGQSGIFQFTDLMSQIERASHSHDCFIKIVPVDKVLLAMVLFPLMCK
jgi:hypothetical protein